jgi:hypothetical protein
MLNQAREFHEAVGLTGLVLTKLDGTARGGAVVSRGRGPRAVSRTCTHARQRGGLKLLRREACWEAWGC